MVGHKSKARLAEAILAKPLILFEVREEGFEPSRVSPLDPKSNGTVSDSSNLAQLRCHKMPQNA